MEDWFAGKSAIVTGAARGIGRGITELLERQGARVVAVDNDRAALEQAFPDGSCVPWHGDLAGGDPGGLAEEIWSRHQPIQLLVNNVGIDSPPQGFLKLDEQSFDRTFETNLRGPWFFTRAIARRLVGAELSGAILFVSSLHATFVRTHPHYSASKAAVSMLVRELAQELAPHRIRVNAVSPGNVRTSMNPLANPGDSDWVRRTVPLGRAGEPADVARIVSVLLSDEWSGYVTGADVPVDGGLALHSWSLDGPEAPSGGFGRLMRRLRR